MDNALYYFLSTIAQSFAALIAFLLAAGQGRISWLDGKISSMKMAIVIKLHPTNTEFYNSTFSVSEIIKQAEKAPSDSFLGEKARELTEFLKEIQVFRKQLRDLVIGCTVLIVAGIALLPLVPIIASCGKVTWGLIAILVVGTAWQAIRIGFFVYNSLEVSLKRKV